MKPARSALFAALALLGTSAWAQHAGHLMVNPNELKWADVPSLPSGAKIAVIEGPLNEAVPFTIRLKVPANYQVPAHWHPAIEHVTVISGTFHMGTGDELERSKTTALNAGSVAIMQPKTHHYAWTDKETIIQVHGVGPWAVNYVNPADDPRKK
jgi:anti-sigma factor ChrR (cupin superfamily)